MSDGIAIKVVTPGKLRINHQSMMDVQGLADGGVKSGVMSAGKLTMVASPWCLVNRRFH